jgi:hypothetical protein
VIESLPGRVHDGNLVIRELTPEHKTSAKLAINILCFLGSTLLSYPCLTKKMGVLKTSVTTVVLSDTGPSTVQKTPRKKGAPAQNEVLPFINTNYCLEAYEYDNEIVIIHNVKGRLKQNIIISKENLLLAHSSRNLVLPILEYCYFSQFEEELP